MFGPRLFERHIVGLVAGFAGVCAVYRCVSRIGSWRLFPRQEMDADTRQRIHLKLKELKEVVFLRSQA